MRRLLLAILATSLLLSGAGCPIRTGICDCDGYHGHLHAEAPIIENAVHVVGGAPTMTPSHETVRISPMPMSMVAQGN